VVVDVVGAEDRARELLQEVVLLVGRAVRSSRSLVPAKVRASSQLAGFNVPSDWRSKGDVRRSMLLAKSKP
jgi:hypothetical protein